MSWACPSARTGAMLATAGADGVVVVWDMISGERKKKIEGWSKEVTSLQFIGATNQILTSAGDNLVRIVDDSGGQIRAMAKLPDFMQSAASAATAGVIIGGGEDSTAPRLERNDRSGTGRIWGRLERENAVIAVEYPCPSIPSYSYRGKPMSSSSSRSRPTVPCPGPFGRRGFMRLGLTGFASLSWPGLMRLRAASPLPSGREKDGGHHGLAAGRVFAPRQLRPQARDRQRVPRPVQDDRHQGARLAVHRAPAAARRDRGQVHDPALDEPPRARPPGRIHANALR